MTANSEPEQTIHLKQRIALIQQQACFAQLNATECAALAKLFTEKSYSPAELIVQEGGLVDSVYLIVSGQAEVTQSVAKKQRLSKKIKMTEVPVALLHAGDAIGLSESGFYAATGKRTATVRALTAMRLLQLDLNHLAAFLQEFPTSIQAFQATTAQLLKMRLIQQALPFTHLSHERIAKLAEQITLETFAPEQIIFNQGEPGDCCYLIQSGRVEISINEPDGAPQVLAVLKSPTLFGEATLITHSVRNATARALESCELLKLPYESLIELVENEGKVAELFMTLMVYRSRPLKNPNVTSHTRRAADGEKITILKNPETHTYFKLDREGWFIWQMLDSHHTLQDITLALMQQQKTFAPERVAALIAKLAAAGLVSNVVVETTKNKANSPRWVRVMGWVQRCLEKRVAISNVDPWMTKLYKKCGYIFFSRFGQCLWAVLSIAGLYTFVSFTPDIISHFKNVANIWLIFIIIIPLTMLATILHELGHALATKHYQREIHYVGVGWYWLSPIAFADTSDMWLSQRWPRIVVNLAGSLTDVMTAGIASICLFFIANGFAQCLFWCFALYTYLNALRMLSPLQDLDGYYVLVDLFEFPRLRHAATHWLLHKSPLLFKQPQSANKYKAEIFYWLVCILYIVMISVVTILVQTVVFKVLNIHSGSLALSLLLPLVVVVLSTLSVVAEMRGK